MKNILILLVALCGVMGNSMATGDSVPLRVFTAEEKAKLSGLPGLRKAAIKERGALRSARNARLRARLDMDTEEYRISMESQKAADRALQKSQKAIRNKKLGNIGMGVGGTLALGGIAGGLTSIFGSKKRQELKKYLFRKDLQGLKLSEADQKLIKQMRLEVLTSTLATLIGVTTLGVGYRVKPKTTKSKSVEKLDPLLITSASYVPAASAV